MHATQLISKSSLLLVDLFLKSSNHTLRYFSTLAKITHLWNQNLRRVFLIWQCSFGAESAVAHALKKLPRCIAGRWGSVAALQDRLMAASASKVAAVLTAAITHKTNVALSECDQEPDFSLAHQYNHDCTHLLIHVLLPFFLTPSTCMSRNNSQN
jgi:hypothetical protein